LSSSAATTGGQIFTTYASNDADSPKEVPFEGMSDKKIVHSIKTHKTMKKWAWLGNFRPKRKKTQRHTPTPF